MSVSISVREFSAATAKSVTVEDVVALSIRRQIRTKFTRSRWPHSFGCLMTKLLIKVSFNNVFYIDYKSITKYSLIRRTFRARTEAATSQGGEPKAKPQGKPFNRRHAGRSQHGFTDQRLGCLHRGGYSYSITAAQRCLAHDDVPQ